LNKSVAISPLSPSPAARSPAVAWAFAAIAANAHATAGDLAAGDGERGLIATDLFKYLKQHLNP